jgi:hypothetical protein
MSEYNSNKTLDNTKISKEDEKEIVTLHDEHLDKTNSEPQQSETKKKSPSRKGKSKKAKSDSNSTSNKSAFEQAATDPTGGTNTALAKIVNIRRKLSNDKVQHEFIVNVADIVGEYAGRKLNGDEKAAVEDLIKRKLVGEILSIKSLD